MPFPALVSLSHDDPRKTLSLHIELFIRYKPCKSQLTLCLLVSHCSHNDQNTQPFALQYDPDNIVPGSVSFDEVDILPNESSRIARAGNPEARKLSFSLNGPCITWKPLLSGDHKPCCSCESPSRELIQLSQARRFGVLFDYNWVHLNSRSLFTRLIHDLENLSGYPLAQYYKEKKYEPTNLSVCTPGDSDVHADAGDTTEDEEPPAYNELGYKQTSNELDNLTTFSPLPSEVMGSPTQANNASASLSPESLPFGPTPHIPYTLKFPLNEILHPIIKKLERNIEERVDYLLDTADTEVSELLEGNKIQIAVEQEDFGHEMRKIKDELLEEGEQQFKELNERVDDEADDAVDRVKKHLDSAMDELEKIIERSRKERKKLAFETKRSEWERKRSRKERKRSRKERERSRKERKRSRREREYSEIEQETL